MKFKVALGGEEREIEVVRQGERLRITHQGESIMVRVVHTDGLHFVLEYEQQVGQQVRRRRLRAAGHVDGDQRQLWVNGSLVNYQRLRQRQESRAQAAGSLSASIPAVVSEVLVEEGQQVRAGEKLILLESMKMILPVQAPHDGTVTAINCAAGDAVQPGVPLVALDADAE
ncbi:MAG TPA: biotin/lipoyl-containing protein [Candidatus Sulfomarinibacteraceae bacterium]|nr:biotin/lipoyl-containing protein [Candidatus Sulfomarinibacteraceae bacterium]